MNLLGRFLKAKEKTGRPLLGLISEALKLRTSFTKLGISEYFDFQLYKNDLTFDQKEMFGGIRTQSILEDILIDDYSRFLSLDKVTMYSLLEGYNLNIPKIVAIYRSQRPSSLLQMEHPTELETFLKNPANLPVYIKRAFGAYGRGNTLVTKVSGDHLITGNGKSELIATFVNSLDDSRSLGWILQTPLQCHREISILTGSLKVSGLRIHTFLTNDKVVPTKAIFKVNVGERDSDNFEHGASGNMLAEVDLSTGIVIRAVSGIGFEQIENPKHPITGADIVGFQIPYWEETLQLVIEGQKAFPGFICPGWDIAICDDGPKILEINAFGDIDLSQHAYRVPFIDNKFLELLQSRGLEQVLKANPAKSKLSPLNNRRGIRKHHWKW